MKGRASCQSITTGQIRAIHACARTRGIDDDLRRDMMRSRFGVESCTGLNRRQAAAFITELKGDTDTARGRTVRDSSKVVRMATPGQRRKIAALAALVSWRREGGFILWLRRRMGQDQVRTAAQAARVIEGLKAMAARQFEDAYGPDWQRRDWADRPEVRRFIDEMGRKPQ